MRYYLIDKVTSIELGKSAEAIKAITLTDQILHDHFPDFPIMPGALIIEGLAQLGGFLSELTFNITDDCIKRALFVQVDKMKFYGISTPGDVLTYKMTIQSIIGDAVRAEAEVTCAGEIRAKGILTFAMHAGAVNSPNVNKNRQDLYRIWTRGLKECPAIR